MAALRRFFLRLLNAVRPARSESDLARELDAHLTLLADNLERRGLTLNISYSHPCVFRGAA